MKKKIIPLMVVLAALLIVLFNFFFKQEEPKPVTMAEYNAKIKNANKAVLVYFSAGWCTVCSKMKPVLAEMESTYNGKLEFFKLDADRDKEVTDEFEINSLPVIMLYNHGNREWINVGIIEKGVLRSKIDPYIH